MYHIQVVGAGYTGAAIAKYFQEKKQKVTVIKRTESGSEELQRLGIKVIQTDLRDRENLPKIPPAHFIVIAIAPENRTEENYEQTYLQAVKNYLEAIQSNVPKPFLIVYLSSTGVYGDELEGIIDESVLPNPKTSRAQILLKAEEQVLNSGFPSAVFRLSGIYGPERNRIKSMRNNEWGMPHTEKWMNMIHLEDIVSAMPVLFKSAEPGKVYLGVDDEPVLENIFYDWLSKKLSVPFPSGLLLPGKSKGKQYNNARLKSLGIQLKYPNFRIGYESFLST